MKQLLKPFFVGVLTGLIAWIAWSVIIQKGKGEITSTRDTTTVVLHDTGWYQVAGSPKLSDSAFTPAAALVDTALILKKYFARYTYSDTLADSNLVLILSDTISQNRIIARHSSYQINKPQLIQHITSTSSQPPKTSFYAGAFISLGEHSGIGPEAFLISKAQTAYGLGYDLQNRTFIGRIAWKIK